MRHALPVALALLALAGCSDRGSIAGRPPAEQVARGQVVYERHCIQCHGPRGRATPDWRTRDKEGFYPPPPLDDSAHAWHHPTEVLKNVVRKGSPPGMGKMPAWEGKLGEGDIDDVVAYIKSLWSDEVFARWQELERQSPAPR